MKNTIGETALDIARKDGQSDLVLFLEEVERNPARLRPTEQR